MSPKVTVNTYATEIDVLIPDYVALNPTANTAFFEGERHIHIYYVYYETR